MVVGAASAVEVVGQLVHCAYPALSDFVELAACMDEEREVSDDWFDLGVARRAAGDLVSAWREAKEHCALVFPPDSEGAQNANPPNRQTRTCMQLTGRVIKWPKNRQF